MRAQGKSVCYAEHRILHRDGCALVVAGDVRIVVVTDVLLSGTAPAETELEG